MLGVVLYFVLIRFFVTSLLAKYSNKETEVFDLLCKENGHCLGERY